MAYQPPHVRRQPVPGRTTVAPSAPSSASAAASATASTIAPTSTEAAASASRFPPVRSESASRFPGQNAASSSLSPQPRKPPSPQHRKQLPPRAGEPHQSRNGQGTTPQRDRTFSPRTTTHTNTNTHASLQAPASDLKPMRRDRAAGGRAVLDPMEMIQSVSRSGGDGAEGDVLKDWTVQEQYRQWIGQRLDKHYETFSTPRHTPPDPAQAEEMQSLASIVLLFRKLREGVLASRRLDAFAIEVFESSARISILAGNRPQLLASLSALVPGLYTAVSPTPTPTPTRSETQSQPPEQVQQPQPLEHVQQPQPSENVQPRPQTQTQPMEQALASLSIAASLPATADARHEFTSIFLLYRLVTSPTPIQAMHELLVSLTAPRAPTLFPPFSVPAPNPDPVSTSTSTSTATSTSTSNSTDPTIPALTAISTPVPTPSSRAIPVPCRPPWTAAPGIDIARMAYPLAAARAISDHSFDPPAYFRLLDDPSAGAYERIVLGWAAESVRERAWERMRRAYLDAGVAWVGKSLGLGRGEGEGREAGHVEVERWVRERGGIVQGARIKMR